MRETLRADEDGTQPDFHTLQPLYAEQNTQGVDLSQKVYRLLDAQYLGADITSGHMTFAKIGPAAWHDELENVLKDATFPDSVTGGVIEIREMMESYYGSCWTYQPESKEAWGIFGKGQRKVRIESTVGQLLAALMQPEDPYYGLHIYAGLVEYRPAAELRIWGSNISLEDLTDSQGLRLSSALSVVRDGFFDEREVRIIYSHFEHDPWVKTNVAIVPNSKDPQRLAKVPCNWHDVIHSITVRSDWPATENAALAGLLATSGLSVPIQKSKIV